jgi:hypothetical protein
MDINGIKEEYESALQYGSKEYVQQLFLLIDKVENNIKFDTGFDVICCKCGAKVHLTNFKEGNASIGNDIKVQACTSFRCICGEFTEQY